VALFAWAVRGPIRLHVSGLLASEARTVFASGLTLTGALLTVVVAGSLPAWVGLRVRQRVRAMPDQRRVASIPVSTVLLMFIVWLPLGMGPVAQAVALIAPILKAWASTSALGGASSTWASWRSSPWAPTRSPC
jgi:hypothetical protein